jgi:cold shock CspA family protein
MTGYIDFWHVKGYGFIKTNDGRDFFVHITSFLIPPGTVPVKGMTVTFDEGRTAKGPCAINVQVQNSSFHNLAGVTNLGGGQS